MMVGEDTFTIDERVTFWWNSYPLLSHLLLGTVNFGGTVTYGARWRVNYSCQKVTSSGRAVHYDGSYNCGGPVLG